MWKDVAKREFIHTVRTGSVWQQIQPMLNASDIRDSGLEVAQFGTLAGMVANGFSISVIPQFALPLCLQPGLVAIPIQEQTALRPIYIVKRRNRGLPAAPAAMWKQLIQAGKTVLSH